MTHNYTNKFKSIAICFIAFIALSSIGFSQSWQPLGPQGEVSSETANFIKIIFDSNDTPYVAYRDGVAAGNNEITVKKFNGTTWEAVGAEGFTAGRADYISLAIDSNDKLYVAYQDDANGDKTSVMAFNTVNSTWETVGSLGFSSGVALFQSLAINNADVPYVSYRDAANANKITVKSFNGSNWIDVGSAGFSATTVAYTSITFNSSDEPYVAFKDYEAITTIHKERTSVMKFNGSTWEYVGSKQFSTGKDSYQQIVIDNTDKPYVIFRDGGNANKTTVMEYSASSWSNVGSAGFSTNSASYQSIDIDNNGTPYVTY